MLIPEPRRDATRPRAKIRLDTMEKNLLGCTSLPLPRLGLRSILFGWRTDEASAHAILDTYREHGGALIQGPAFQLADPHATNLSNAADRIVRRWWQGRGVPRAELILSARCHPGAAPTAGLTDRLMAACDGALERLGTDYLDLFVLDASDRTLPLAAAREALDVLVRTGRVRYLAMAGAQAWRAADTLRLDPRRNHCRLEALQADYSLHRRAHVETELMDLCAEHRLSLIARVALGAERATAAPGGNWLREHFAEGSRHHLARTTATIAANHGATPSQVALAWVLHHAAVTTALVSAYSASHLHELLDAANLALTAEDLADLNRASRSQRLTLAAGRPHMRQSTWLSTFAGS